MENGKKKFLTSKVFWKIYRKTPIFSIKIRAKKMITKAILPEQPTFIKLKKPFITNHTYQMLSYNASLKPFNSFKVVHNSNAIPEKKTIKKNKMHTGE